MGTEETARRQVAIFEQTLRLPESFLALNEIDEAIWLGSYAPGRTGFLWANTAGLFLWGKSSVEEFQQVDIVSDRSDAVAKVHDDLHQHTLAGKVKTGRRTLYPNGKPHVLDFDIRPVQLVISATGEEIRAMMVRGKPVQLRDEGDQEATRALEMIRHSRTMSLLFSTEGNLIHSNVSANSFYRLDNKSDSISATDSTPAMTLRALLLSCEFESDEEVDSKLTHILSLRTGDAQLVLEVKKRTGPCWTVIQFIPTKDPVSGLPAILVNESDTTTLVTVQLRLMEAQAAQDNFLAAISHELRTPLNGIMGLADALLVDTSCSAKMLTTLKLMRSSGQRLAGLVNDILDAASARHNTLVVRQEAVELADVCDSACGVLAPLVKPGVVLTNVVPESIPTIEGDSARITQILTNLLGNAIKFTDQGHITLSAQMADDGTCVRISVEDSGIGIPASKIDEVWGAFKQGDQSVTRKYGGTGLGLALVKELTEAHGGTVAVESVHAETEQSGRPSGTTFTVSLPVRQKLRNASPEPRPSPVNQSAQSPKRGSIAVRSAQSADDAIWGERRNETTKTNTRGDRPSPVTGGSFRSLPLSKRGAERPSWARNNSVTASENRHIITLLRKQLEAAEGRASTLERELASCKLRLRELARTHTLGASGGVLRHYSDAHDGFEVLSVDDCEINHAVVESNLAPLGYKVTVCMNGAEALDLIAARDYLPDLVLLDSMMPGMSGVETCEKLRDKFTSCTLPVIMVSARAAEADIVQSLAAGCNDYLTKPYGGEELRARIDVQIRTRQTRKAEMQRSETCQQQQTPHLPPHTPRHAVNRKQSDPQAHSPTDSQAPATRCPFNVKSCERCAGLVDLYPFLQSHLAIEGLNGSDLSPTVSVGDECGGGKSGIEVFLVDDNKDTHRAVDDALAASGYTVTVCTDALAALRMLEERTLRHVPSVVLVGTETSQMSGLEVCRRIRERHSPAALPVVMLSGSPDSTHAVRALETGCNDFVCTPFVDSQLLARVRSHLRVAAAAAIETDDKLSEGRTASAARPPAAFPGGTDGRQEGGRLQLCQDACIQTEPPRKVFRPSAIRGIEDSIEPDFGMRRRSHETTGSSDSIRDPAFSSISVQSTPNTGMQSTPNMGVQSTPNTGVQSLEHSHDAPLGSDDDDTLAASLIARFLERETLFHQRERLSTRLLDKTSVMLHDLVRSRWPSSLARSAAAAASDEVAELREPPEQI